MRAANEGTRNRRTRQLRQDEIMDVQRSATATGRKRAVRDVSEHHEDGPVPVVHTEHAALVPTEATAPLREARPLPDGHAGVGNADQGVCPLDVGREAKPPRGK